MAVGSAPAVSETATAQGNRSYALPMVLMVSLYFSIGFITALNDILVPHFKDLFHLTNTMALMVQFCFFGAYFIMSLPCGWIVGRIGYKPSILAALCTMAAGLFLFVPASIVILYPVFLFALFVVGSGLALLQVAINPYVGALGPSETAASRLNLCGGLNSLATTIAPKLGAAFIFIAAGATTAQLAHSVRLPYVLIAVFTLIVAAVTYFVPLPELIAKRDVKASGASKEGGAWSFTHLRLGAVAIFAYVGAEVATGSILINFLGQPSMGSISHGTAATYVSLYWGGAMVARFIGAWALTRIRDHVALAWVASAALLITLATIFVPVHFLHLDFSLLGHSMRAAVPFGAIIVCCGLFNSVMWPCIFPLSLKGLGKFTSQGSGILVAMIVGGALVPILQGYLADKFGYQHSFVVVLMCYAYVLFFALSGYKIREPRLPVVAGYIAPVEIA
jgi:FHS family L-fucose permease-like MFS transporter